VSDDLYSPLWYRVACLRPGLSPQARIERHSYRGQTWYVLHNQLTGRLYRFSPSAHHLIGLMDGARPVETILEATHAALGDAAPTQQECIQLLAQLYQADVLRTDVTPDTRELFERFLKQRRTRWKQRLRSPLFVRIPLIDPDRFLERWAPRLRFLFTWPALTLWAVVVLLAAVQAGTHWAELTENLIDRVLAPQGLLLIWLCYPLVKALHELAHAFAVKVWGGEVHDMGITLLALIPVPYVDASTASAFPQAQRRIIVSAAGILVELFVAALALFAWLSLEPGLARSAAFTVIFIGGVSTVLVNGNPLLRYDGYYMFADAIGMPNLASRSTRYIGYLVSRYAFGVQQVRSPATSPDERPWLAFYALASFIYRTLIVFAIILFIAERYAAVGVILAAWAVIGLFVAPLGKRILYLLNSPQLERRRLRAVTVSALGVLVPLVTLFLLPVPLATRAEGIVWPPEQAEVRAEVDGVVARLLARPDSYVRRGEALIELEDPLLNTQVRILEAKSRELEARRDASRSSQERVEVAILEEQLRVARAELARARERLDARLISSPADGRFLVSQPQDLPGRYFRHGEVIAYVADLNKPTVRAVVPQSDIGLVRARTRAVSVRLSERIAGSLSARLGRVVPAGTYELPSPALGTTGGGSIPTDPADPDGRRTLRQVFEVELTLPAPVTTLGGRAYVRFDHGLEPLAQQWFRRIRQGLLKRFHV
jgi:putative peptide zinc metalloprotease protein